MSQKLKGAALMAAGIRTIAGNSQPKRTPLQEKVLEEFSSYGETILTFLSKKVEDLYPKHKEEKILLGLRGFMKSQKIFRMNSGSLNVTDKMTLQFNLKGEKILTDFFFEDDNDINTISKYGVINVNEKELTLELAKEGKKYIGVIYSVLFEDGDDINYIVPTRELIIID